MKNHKTFDNWNKEVTGLDITLAFSISILATLMGALALLLILGNA